MGQSDSKPQIKPIKSQQKISPAPESNTKFQNVQPKSPFKPQNSLKAKADFTRLKVDQDIKNSQLNKIHLQNNNRQPQNNKKPASGRATSEQLKEDPNYNMYFQLEKMYSEKKELNQREIQDYIQTLKPAELLANQRQVKFSLRNKQSINRAEATRIQLEHQKLLQLQQKELQSQEILAKQQRKRIEVLQEIKSNNEQIRKSPVYRPNENKNIISRIDQQRRSVIDNIKSQSMAAITTQQKYAEDDSYVFKKSNQAVRLQLTNKK